MQLAGNGAAHLGVMCGALSGPTKWWHPGLGANATQAACWCAPKSIGGCTSLAVSGCWALALRASRRHTGPAEGRGGAPKLRRRATARAVDGARGHHIHIRWDVTAADGCRRRKAQAPHAVGALGAWAAAVSLARAVWGSGRRCVGVLPHRRQGRQGRAGSAAACTGALQVHKGCSASQTSDKGHQDGRKEHRRRASRVHANGGVLQIGDQAW